LRTDGQKIRIRSFSSEKDDGLIASYSARLSCDERIPTDGDRFERDRRVGVDLERLSLLAKRQDKADKILSQLEPAMFRATTCAGERSRQPLRIWTRKEALLKAWRGALVDLHARSGDRRDGWGLHLSVRRSDV
jgi:hypothetical protein